MTFLSSLTSLEHMYTSARIHNNNFGAIQSIFGAVCPYISRNVLDGIKIPLLNIVIIDMVRQECMKQPFYMKTYPQL